MKERKLTLVGPADSEKTSCFFFLFEDNYIIKFSASKYNCVPAVSMWVLTLYSGLILSMYVASVVRDGRFSGHMINSRIQVVFMDE